MGAASWLWASSLMSNKVIRPPSKSYWRLYLIPLELMKSSTRGGTRTKRHSFLCSFVITLFYRRCWIYSFLCLCVNKNTSNEKSFIFVSLFLDADHLLSTLNMSALSFILHYNTLCSILPFTLHCVLSTIHHPLSNIHLALLDATHILQVLLLLGDSVNFGTLPHYFVL